MDEKYDILVDTIATRSTHLKENSLNFIEKQMPERKMYYSIHIADLLADRLALAEHGLQNKWSFPHYRNKAKRMDVWF